jgi:hypothetical protein
MAFFFVSFMTGFMYFTDAMSAKAALIMLAFIFGLGALLYRAFTKRRAMLRIEHLPTTIKVSDCNFSIDAPHGPQGADLSVPVQRVRSVAACLIGLEGFEIGLGSLSMRKGDGIRITVELDDNSAQDVLIKCDLDQNQTLQLETDLRNALGLPPLKPP